MPLVADIAEAVKTDLNGGTFSQPFTAERLYQPLFELPDMQQLHVTVVPSGVAVLPATRKQCFIDVTVDVAVQKKFAQGDAVELDPLMALVEEIRVFFQLQRLAAYPSAVWQKTENKPIYALEHMDELRQFTSVLSLTFRVTH